MTDPKPTAPEANCDVKKSAVPPSGPPPSSTMVHGQLATAPVRVPLGDLVKTSTEILMSADMRERMKVTIVQRCFVDYEPQDALLIEFHRFESQTGSYCDTNCFQERAYHIDTTHPDPTKPGISFTVNGTTFEQGVWKGSFVHLKATRMGELDKDGTPKFRVHFSSAKPYGPV